LWNSFNLVLRRLAEKLVVGQIHAEQVTVADQMEYVLERIKTQKSFVFSALFSEKISLRRLVATFLAVLELTRLRKLQLEQTEAFTDILCVAVEEITLETPVDRDTLPVPDEQPNPPPQA
jgi:segregation and condensation protein A